MDAVARPGKGALARSGKYWYPVRLIHLEDKGAENEPCWRVEWWRGCQFEVTPNERDHVLQSEIVDELWCDREQRRLIQVSLTPFLNDKSVCLLI